MVIYKQRKIINILIKVINILNKGEMNMIKAQRFGVEIEMTGLTRKKAAETVAE